MPVTNTTYRPSDIIADPRLQLTKDEQLDAILDAAVKPTQESIQPYQLKVLSAIMAVASVALMLIGMVMLSTGVGFGFGLGIIGIGVALGSLASVIAITDFQPHVQVVRDASKHRLQDQFSPNGPKKKSRTEAELFAEWKAFQATGGTRALAM